MTAAEPVEVDVWFDASCAWTWATTRWLVDGVAPQRPLSLRWHVMSLAVLHADRETPPEKAEKAERSRRALRLLAAAEQQHGSDALGRLYTALGSRMYREGRRPDAAVAAEALAEAGLPADLVSALDDAGLDDVVLASHEQGQAAVGEQAGSPVLALGGRGFFGPVLTPVPYGQEALDLFEGLRLLAGTASFSELKRARSGPPDAG